MLQPQIYFLSRINAPAKRVGHSLTNQLAERINSFFLSRTIFSSPFFLCVDGQRAMSQQHKQQHK